MEPKILLLPGPSAGDAPFSETMTGLRKDTEIACGYHDSNTPFYLREDESIVVGRAFTRLLIDANDPDDQREDGDPACVHYLKTIEFIDRNTRQNKELISQLRKANIPMSVIRFIAYFHDHRENYRKDFPTSSRISFFVYQCWKGEAKFIPLIIKALALLTDPPEKEGLSKEQERRHKIRRLKLQASIANIFGMKTRHREDFDVELASHIVSAVRSADKFASHTQDLMMLLEAISDPELMKAITLKQVRKAIQRVCVRYHFVVKDLDKIPESEKKRFFDIRNAMIFSGKLIIKGKKQNRGYEPAPHEAGSADTPQKGKEIQPKGLAGGQRRQGFTFKGMRDTMKCMTQQYPHFTKKRRKPKFKAPRCQN